MDSYLTRLHQEWDGLMAELSEASQDVNEAKIELAARENTHERFKRLSLALGSRGGQQVAQAAVLVQQAMDDLILAERRRERLLSRALELQRRVGNVLSDSQN